jgi:hypothetical protein
MLEKQMECPIKYKSDQDRLQNGAEKQTTWAWLLKNHTDIIKVHRKVQKREDLLNNEVNLIDIVLRTVVQTIYHDWAETEFLRGEFERGKSDK